MSAGSTITLKIRLSSTSASSTTIGTSGHALVGDIIIPYQSNY
jgi:hypothetical protein